VLKTQPSSYFLLPPSEEQVDHVFWRAMKSARLNPSKEPNSSFKWTFETIEFALRICGIAEV